MPAITLIQAQAKLAVFMDALDAVAKNQSYKVGDRSLTRADGRFIAEQIKFWEARVDQMTANGGKRRRGPAMRGVRL